MRSKIRLCCKVAHIAMLFMVGLIIAGIIFPALNILFKPANAKHYRDALKLRWLKWFSAILNLQVTIKGDLPIKANFLVSNHISWLDIIVLGCFSPAHFVAKNDILAWPVIGYLARQGGTIFVRRGDKQQVKLIAEKMVWLLKQNSMVIAFPEGTTTRGDVVLPFHASLFQAALLTKAAIQPVALQYLGEAKKLAPFIGEDSFVPHLIKVLSLNKVEVQVDVLPEISTVSKTRHSISCEARSVILGALSEDDLSRQVNVKASVIGKK